MASSTTHPLSATPARPWSMISGQKMVPFRSVVQDTGVVSVEVDRASCHGAQIFLVFTTSPVPLDGQKTWAAGISLDLPAVLPDWLGEITLRLGGCDADGRTIETRQSAVILPKAGERMQLSAHDVFDNPAVVALRLLLVMNIHPDTEGSSLQLGVIGLRLGPAGDWPGSTDDQTRAAQLLAEAGDARLTKVVAASSKEIVLLADEANSAALATQGLTARPLSEALVGRLADLAQGAGVICVCSLVGESWWVARLTALLNARRPEGPRVRVIGLYSHLYAIASTRTVERIDRALLDRIDATPLPEKSVVIVSLPRSGSYFLSEILEKLGAGLPTEHLRPVVCSLFEQTDSGFDGKAWLRMVSALTTRNGIFSTKVIFPFLRRVLAIPRGAELVRQALAQGNIRLIYLWRANKLDQAISGYRARHSRVFRMTGSEAKSAHRSVEFSFDDLHVDMQVLEESERTLERYVAGLALPTLVQNYESLSDDVEHYAEGVRQFVEPGLQRVSFDVFRNQKMRDDLTDKFRATFIAEARRRNLPQTEIIFSTGAAQLRDLAGQDTASWPEVFVEYPQKKTLVAYQVRDWLLVDYKGFCPTPRPELRFRGPAIQPDHAFFSCIGAAQTLGAMVRDPFPTRVARELGCDVLNLGFAGAGPRFYLDRPAVIDAANTGKVCVIQVMSGRSAPNSRFDNPTGRNILVDRRTGETLDDIRAYDKFCQENGLEALKALLQESRATWQAQMRDLLARIRVPKLLFWFSERDQALPEGGTKTTELYGRFPHLIGPEEVAALDGLHDGFVSCISTRGSPEPLVSRIDGQPTTIILSSGHVRNVNDYYPSSQMHEDAARALAPVLGRLMAPLARADAGRGRGARAPGGVGHPPGPDSRQR